MWEAWHDFLNVWEDWRVDADEYRELDGERVLVLEYRRARAKGSGLRIGQMARETPSKGASLFHVRDGKVTRLITYFDRDRALADLGLEGTMPKKPNTKPRPEPSTPLGSRPE